MEDKHYLKFSNFEKKSWIVPIENMSMALHLYQPSGVKGKLIKRLLPSIYRFPFLSRLIQLEKTGDPLSRDVIEKIRSVIGERRIEYSVFEGTLSVHKKRTIQLFKGKQILGYAKISNNKEVVKLFKHEQMILDCLHERGVDPIPHCCYCGAVNLQGDNILFVQSTIKTKCSEVVHKWDQRHYDFLRLLHLRTKEVYLFEDTDLARSLTVLENYLYCLSERERNMVRGHIEIVRRIYGDREVEFSAYHADFTPWNMFVEKGELFVFDFEYAGLSYPPFLDWFHFFTQTAIFEKRWSADEIIRVYKEERLPLKDYFSDVDLAYRVYLLDIISKYIEREQGQLSSSTNQMKAFWIKILEGI